MSVGAGHGESIVDARWAFADHFRWVPLAAPEASWELVLPLIAAARARHHADVARLKEWLTESDNSLKHLGGDPLREQWSAFRPLRLSREEDWSDWLAHLIRTSQTGTFLSSMLGQRFPGLSEARKVIREWPLPGGYRADIGMELEGGSWLHLEVKIGDKELEKTAATGLAMRDQVHGREVHDVLLLPPDDRPLWDAVREGMATNRLLSSAITARANALDVIDWRDIARSLRHALREPVEPVIWQAWALAFCGAVEQSILGLPCLRPGREDTLSLVEIERVVQYHAYIKGDEE